MNLCLNLELANNYKNSSQIARVLTEDWVFREIYCPSCGETLQRYENNKPVADFCCKTCFEDFELKSKVGKIGKKVSAGAYGKMIERIESKDRPNFFFMGYQNQIWKVSDFFVVPKHFFVPRIIEKRNALSINAKRAGWIGSNILFSHIPQAGQIFYVKDGIQTKRNAVLEKWQKTVFLNQIKNVESKGWILDIMHCIESLGKDKFSLQDMYQFEPMLAQLHPNNTHIKAKIRQQLQVLRDRNFLTFLGDGNYTVS